jgi:hypothetical protein
MILLDFYSGSHGHFLEYVINTYIYGGPRVTQVFTELGTCHGIRADSEYCRRRVVTAAHYSEFKIPVVDNPHKVIRITANSDMENICYQINVQCRAGDMFEKKKSQEINDNIKDSPVELRMDYYSKFSLAECGYQKPSQWRWDSVDHYEFPMRNLYDALNFYSELQQLSKFLNHSFKPDPSLMQLWQTFCDKNHGLQAWKNAIKYINRY